MQIIAFVSQSIILYHIPAFQRCRSRTLHSQSGRARISALAALPDYRVHTGMRVCSFAVALVHIDASTCMCNILQSIPTQLNNLAMQLQTSWGVGPVSSTIQCYMDLSRALYVLSCHGYAMLCPYVGSSAHFSSTAMWNCSFAVDGTNRQESL